MREREFSLWGMSTVLCHCQILLPKPAWRHSLCWLAVFSVSIRLPIPHVKGRGLDAPSGDYGVLRWFAVTCAPCSAEKGESSYGNPSTTHDPYYVPDELPSH